MLGGTLRIVRDGIVVTSVEVTGEVFEHAETLIAGGAESAIRAELVIGGQPRVVTSHVFLSPLTPGGPDAGLPDAGAEDASALSDAADAVDAGAEAPVPGCACRGAGAPASRLAGMLEALVALAIALGAARRRRSP